MKYCRHCKVKIENNIEYCPLCNNVSDLKDEHFEKDYPYIVSHYNRTFFLKIITFLAIGLGAGSFLANYLVKTESLWVFIAVGAIVYLWISTFGLITSAKNIGFTVLMQLLLVSGFLFLIDLTTGYYKWSINYIIPFLIIVASLTISVIILFRPMKFREYAIYQLVIAILGVLSLLLLIFKLSDVNWPLLVAVFHAVMSFFGMLIFADRKTKNELRKRFHI